MNRLVLGAAGIALVLALVLVGTPYKAPDTAHAQGLINFDIDPDTTGNTANNLGTVENCVEIVVASPAFDGVSDYNIDVVVFGDTDPPTAYDAEFTYNASVVSQERLYHGAPS
jgi:hypothetical protein